MGSRTAKTQNSELKEMSKARLEEIKAKAEELKKRHNLKDGQVRVVIVGDKVAYVRQPNRRDIGMSRSLSADDISYWELLLNTIWLEGDAEIKDDDEYFMNAVNVLGHLIEYKVAELKKF